MPVTEIRRMHGRVYVANLEKGSPGEQTDPKTGTKTLSFLFRDPNNFQDFAAEEWDNRNKEEGN